VQAQHPGWNVIQKLKLSESTASIPLLLCTAAVASVREQEAFLRQKGIHVLFKPFGIKELKQTVWQLLQPG
jgi:response regulator RpfG family c-di-GMP phosphodiesterase